MKRGQIKLYNGIGCCYVGWNRVLSDIGYGETGTATVIKSLEAPNESEPRLALNNYLFGIAGCFNQIAKCCMLLEEEKTTINA